MFEFVQRHQRIEFPEALQFLAPRSGPWTGPPARVSRTASTYVPTSP
ncbi:MAG: hypothetical protein ABJA98_02315, partial [Acidobacteriota bacterium]